MTEREAFAERIQRYRENGEREVLSTGIAEDAVLAGELREPGSDRRFGVALVCRPNREIREQIAAIRLRLMEHEPDQYYYPPQDLHLTLVEICHSRTEEEADRTAAAVRELPSDWLRSQPAVALDAPTLAYGSRGAALNFLPCDGGLQQLRSAIREELTGNGVAIESRYLPMSAHVTFLRYTTRLRTPPGQWVECLNRCPVQPAARWVPSPVWLTWGGTWYGMNGRVSRYGPMVCGK